ncbi:Hypothetical protein D9617_6g093260 [Elsinoe fawcettii]|nr:Hypothetical protein D9617_6g093260 [Elsinoe fawcettii]
MRPPLVAETATSSPIIGGALGSVACLASVVTRRLPNFAMFTAAITTISLTVYASYLRMAQFRAQKEFLNAHGIAVPKTKFIERWNKLDLENIIFAAGVAGVMLSLGKIKPGGVMAHCFSFGAAAASAGMLFAPLPSAVKANEELWKDMEKAEEWREELGSYYDRYGRGI